MIRATDDEAYADELWGDAKRWDDNLKQFVPTEDDAKPEQGDVQPVDAPAEPKVDESTPAKAEAPKGRTRG